MAGKKNPEATPEYLSSLRAESEHIGSLLSGAKIELFKLTPTAKLFNTDFEMWRQKCTSLTKDFLRVQGEIERVEKLLGR